jgi:hypothetical protein
MSATVRVEAVAGLAAAAPFWPLDAFEMSESGRVDALVALQQLSGWVEAQSLRLMAAMADAAEPYEAEFVADQIACALQLSPGTAAARLDLAASLLARLPATLAAVESGALTVRHAQVLLDETRNLPGDLVTEVERRVLAKAPGKTVAGFRALIKRAVLAVDPRDAEARHRAAAEQRRVCHRPVEDGMAEIWALLPADAAAALMTRLNAEADRLRAVDRTTGEVRTADQRRADALAALAAQGLADPTLPAWHGRRPAVQVTVAASTLLGLDDQPGELEGYGPIPADMARNLAADPTGTWRRLITDPAGRLLDYGTTTYRPPQDLADFVIARDRRCRFPGCRLPARRCDIDHQVPFRQPGGVTAPRNCQVLCEHHHRLKHEAGWTVSGDPAGELQWTTPTGHRYRAPPGRYG